MTDVVNRLQGDIKQALKSGDKSRLGVLRLLLSAVKQTQIDSRQTLDDAGFIAVVQKMIKQRRESIRHFQAANRTDLADKEEEETRLLEEFLPATMSDDEVEKLITAAIADNNAASIKDMGKVMNTLKPRLAGRADMATVSARVREKLSA